MLIKEIAKDITKEEFINSDYIKVCPCAYNLPFYEPCYDGWCNDVNCEECWNMALEDIEFKVENQNETIKKHIITIAPYLVSVSYDQKILIDNLKDLGIEFKNADGKIKTMSDILNELAFVYRKCNE